MDDVLPRKKRVQYESHSRKGKSGLSLFKKRLKISKIYKRLATKSSVHSRNIRSLMHTWSQSEIKSLVDQYEITSMLKSLSETADGARLVAKNASRDFLKLRKNGFLCDLTINTYNANHQEIESAQFNSTLFLKRTGLVLNKEKALNDLDAFNTTDNLLCLPSHSSPINYNYTQNKLQLMSNNFPPSFLKKLMLNVYSDNSFNDSLKDIRSESFQLNTPKKLKNSKDYNEDKASGTPSKLTIKLSTTLTSKKVPSFNRGFYSDMRDLFLSGNTSGDIRLTCVPSLNIGGNQSSFLCHSFVLASRSGFLKSVIEKQKNRSDLTTDSCSPNFMTIQLESKVFPPKYLPVVLYAMYTDEIDLQRISKDNLRPNNDLECGENVKDLMEILYLGRFLEFPYLTQACEDLIALKLNSSNIVEVLRWSSKPHGSLWLRRKVVQYIRDNLTQVSGVLCDLTKQELSEVIRSDYVNAPELDILKVVLDWGEHELIRNIEAREPNLVQTHITLNSRTKSYRTSSLMSTRRHELLLTSNSEELHDCTADLLSAVRLPHILPPNHEIVANAMKRGVISSPPEHLLEWHHPGGTTPNSQRAFFWLRDKAGLGFSPPRLFTPHWEEAKAILEDRICQESTSNSTNVNLCAVRQNSTQGDSVLPSGGVVPDALYMVGSGRTAAAQHKCDTCRKPEMGVTSLATTRLKYINKTFPVPDPSIASKLLSHERHLRQTAWVKQILQSCHSASVGLPHCCCRSQRYSANALEIGENSVMLCNLCRAEHYIRLICVREQNLPDATSDVLRRPHLYYDPDDLLTFHSSTSYGEKETRINPGPQIPRRKLQKLFQKKTRNKTCDVIPPVVVHRSWNRSCDFSSNSDLSEGDNNEWPFPYINAMQSRPLRGHNSDSSISIEAINASIPDVAASADSTIKSLRSLLSSSSNSDSVASAPFPGDLFLLQNTEEPKIEEKNEIETVTFKRKASALSYAQYLSMKKAPTKTFQSESLRSSSSFRLYPKTIFNSTAKSKSNSLYSPKEISSFHFKSSGSTTKDSLEKLNFSFNDTTTSISNTSTNNAAILSKANELDVNTLTTMTLTSEKIGLPDDIQSSMLHLNVEDNLFLKGKDRSSEPSCSYAGNARNAPDICASSTIQFIDADNSSEVLNDQFENQAPFKNHVIDHKTTVSLQGDTLHIQNKDSSTRDVPTKLELLMPKNTPESSKPNVNVITPLLNHMTGKENFTYDNMSFFCEEPTDSITTSKSNFSGLDDNKKQNIIKTSLDSLPGAAFLLNETIIDSSFIDKETTL